MVPWIWFCKVLLEIVDRSDIWVSSLLQFVYVVSNTSALVVQAYAIPHSDESYGVCLGSTVLRNFLVLVEKLTVLHLLVGQHCKLPGNLIIQCWYFLGVGLTQSLFFAELSLIWKIMLLLDVFNPHQFSSIDLLVVNSLSNFLLFLMWLINRFTCAVILKKFLEERIPCFVNLKGFSHLYFIFVRWSPWNLKDHVFLSSFFRKRFRVCFNYCCVPLRPLVWILPKPFRTITTQFVIF